jgi:hypothetical protein
MFAALLLTVAADPGTLAPPPIDLAKMTLAEAR